MIEELRKWEDYSSIQEAFGFIPGRTKVDVACPECGKQLWRRNDIVLTSHPAKYQYECECGWIGYAFK